MLRLRREQFEVFEQIQRQKFVGKVRRYCKGQLPVCCKGLSDETLTLQIERSIAQAREMGLEWQNNLTTVCLLNIKFRATVLEDDEVRQQLSDSETPDVHFRHLFTEPASKIWTRFTNFEIEEETYV